MLVVVHSNTKGQLDMVRILMLTGAVMLFGAASALAQEAPNTTMPSPAATPTPEGRQMHDRDGWMAMRRQRLAMFQKSAGFRFKRGDAEIDIKCAADEPMRACVEAAATLIDKVTASVPH